MNDWSELPNDLLALITKRLVIYEDFAAFSKVCRSWRSFASKENLTKFLHLPCLMLPQKQNSNSRRFFNPSKRFVHHLLPKARGTKCWGSNGWLITLSEDLSINLLNPLTSRQIQLPHRRTFRKQYSDTDCFRPFSERQKILIRKAVLSSNPSHSSDYAVMVIYGSSSNLAFSRPGDEIWTTVNPWCETLNRYQMITFLDIAYCRGQFYAIGINGEVVVCNIQVPDPKSARIIATLPSELLGLYKKLYIVELSGELLVVLRLWMDPKGLEPKRRFYVPEEVFYQTIGFQVFRLDMVSMVFTEMKNLGKMALFLGHSSSMSMAASDFSGCEANCIYFTDDFSEYYCSNSRGGGKDMGVFNLEDRSIKPLYRVNSNSLCHLSPPMWVVPSL